jgi:hypothetical protein
MNAVNPKDGSRPAGRKGEKKRRWLSQFVPHRLEMLLHPAWQKAPRPLRKVLERLEIEHLRHGGYNNGELFVSYLQFVDCGVSKRSIRPTLQLGEDLGLIEVIQGHETVRSDIRPANSYRLTYVPARGKENPTDEWMRISSDQVDRLVVAFKASEMASVRATRKERREAA